MNNEQLQTIKSQEFYELMQHYRWSADSNLHGFNIVAKAYDAVIAHVDARLSQNKQPQITNEQVHAAIHAFADSRGYIAYPDSANIAAMRAALESFVPAIDATSYARDVDHAQRFRCLQDLDATLTAVGWGVFSDRRVNCVFCFESKKEAEVWAIECNKNDSDKGRHYAIQLYSKLMTTMELDK